MFKCGSNIIVIYIWSYRIIL